MKLYICAFTLLFAGCSPYLGDFSKEDRAKLKAREIEAAYKKYYVENGEWPSQLEDIADQLEDGSGGLTDPWGEQYHFTEVREEQTDGTVCLRPVIWTERMSDGKAKFFPIPKDAMLTEEMKDDGRKEKIARKEVRALEQACKKYHAENGKLPAKLIDIANLLEKGEQGLTDPWGSNYKFAAGKTKTTDNAQVEQPFIWSERRVNEMLRVCGSRPPQEKKKQDDVPLAKPK